MLTLCQTFLSHLNKSSLSIKKKLVFMVFAMSVNQISIPLKLRKADIFIAQHSEATIPTLELISCDRSHKRYDICSRNGPTIMNPTKSTFHVVDPTSTSSSPMTVSEKIRPYPRKWETNLMSSHIKELTLLVTSSQLDVRCDIHHRNSALVFSSGGYTRNPYHGFDDGFIPLFVTLRTTYPSNENQPILVLSPYPIINLDNETSTHCFPSATVGLISHGFMTIDPTLLPNSETLHDFRVLLETAYAKTASTSTPQPRLVVVSRSGENVGRVMSNEGEVVVLAKEIGFDVTVFEPTKFTSLIKAYRLLNNTYAMMGVCYGKPAKEIGLDYLEYKIKVNESTLVHKYGEFSMVLKDPKSTAKKDWSIIKKIYLKEQDVRVNLVRFENYFTKAYKKAKKFMDKVG
ncbi:hypothetical protein MKW94_023001 [Papaver nudicaule]|uniref:Uncharacterized protein n=1 Tax=Papaver nudicaule TaxID=74823 RepID=A0AA41SE73_PAPNU|nr:hypothetical protein [Papaver nudicaule]